MDEDTFEFNIYKKSPVSECNLKPTETNSMDFAWLFAKNNKYSLVDVKKIGRWVVSVSKDNVNGAWHKIKSAVKSGKLWKAKVSTSDVAKPEENHAIMIDTKDYTDLDDVILVLDYLESLEIKPRNAVIKYKVYQQIRTDIYRGGGQKSWIYSSDTIRPMILTRTMDDSVRGVSEFDVNERKTLIDCNLCPTEISKSDFVWLGAQNNKYSIDSMDEEKIGKWGFFLSKHNIDEIWNKIKVAVKSGELWCACMSTADPVNSEEDHFVMIFTKDCTDLKDIIQVLDFLENSEIKPSNIIAMYKANRQRHADIHEERSWMYSSFTIRALSSCGHINNDTYRFDIHEKKLVIDCILYPSETIKRDFEWLKAVNNKYADDSIDDTKKGKWVLVVPKYSVDESWDKIKIAVTNGELWYSCVSTIDPEKPGGNHTIMIYTKDYNDRDDIISVLEYLEGSKIESHYLDLIYYKTDQQTNADDTKGTEKTWKYCSKTVRSNDLIHDVYEFDIQKNELVSDCNLYPTGVKRFPAWFYAKNNKYTSESIDNKKVGKWHFVLQEDRINAAWDKIKMAVKEGELWCAKVSTCNPFLSGIYIVAIFTKDFTDLDDIIRVLGILESYEIKSVNDVITYEKNQRTNQNEGCKRPWMYSSFTIRSIGLNQPIHDTYEYDILENKLVTDCTSYPSETSKGDYEWLCAHNNKYTNQSMDDEKIGKWVLFSGKDEVDEAWDQIKMGVKIGELWSSKVSTTDPLKRKDNHTIFIFTNDFSDKDDVIRVLDYLVSCRIKPSGKVIKYTTGQQIYVGQDSEKSQVYSSDTIRLRHRYEFDIHENKLVTDSNLRPSQTTHQDAIWLQARNNKYADDTIDEDKIGKWMLFIERNIIDEVWDKIKMAVKNGDLWRSSVSTVDPGRPIHAIMIYTRDFNDLEDVIRVLEYLEISGLKPPHANIKYKSDEQSYENIYQGGRERAFLYSSRTVRLKQFHKDTYRFDIEKMELVTDCTLYPTDIAGYLPWLYATNNKYPDVTLDLESKVGKWMLFVLEDKVNAAWDKIKIAVANGELWSVKVSATNSKNPYCGIMVYTVDYTNVNDVVKVLDYLENSGLKSRDVIIKYREEHPAGVNRAGIWCPGSGKAWLYLSNTVRAAVSEG